MTNLSGIFALFSLLYRPSMVIPHIQVSDITWLDWSELHSAGIRFLVFDKDNCLTKPHKDELELALLESWREAQRIFGRFNILIVSNSSGSSDDPRGLGAEALSRALGGVPVLCHRHKKPAKSCVREALEYFVALTERREEVLSTATQMPPGSVELMESSRKRRRLLRNQVPIERDGYGSILLVGDRTMTDVILAHRMDDEISRRTRVDTSKERVPPHQCVSVLTTGLWSNEGRVNMLMRGLENKFTTFLISKGFHPGQKGFWTPRKDTRGTLDWQSLAVKPAIQPAIIHQVNEVTFAHTKDPIPHNTPPALGSIIFTNLLRPLPLRLASSLQWVAGSRPASWLSNNVKQGWGTVIKGIEEGVNAPSPLLNSRRRIGRRAYSTIPPRPPSLPRRNWIAASSALVLVPACYYGGVYIHDLQDQRKAERELHQTIPAQQHSQAQRSDLIDRRKSLELALYHLHNEQTEITTKLARLGSRHSD